MQAVIITLVDKSDGAFSQVLWLGQSEVNTTWEKAEVLPTSVIQEFEEGIKSQVMEEHYEAYGMNRSTLIADSCIPNECKKARADHPVLESTTG